MRSPRPSAPPSGPKRGTRLKDLSRDDIDVGLGFDNLDEAVEMYMSLPPQAKAELEGYKQEYETMSQFMSVLLTMGASVREQSSVREKH